MWAIAGIVWILTVPTFSDNDVFGDDLIHVNEQDIQKHVASSVENLGELLCSEQELIHKLLAFKSALEKEITVTKDKSAQIMVNIIKKLEKYKLLETLSQEKCLQHVSNPINCFLLLKRTTRIWTQKLKLLKLNLKSCNICDQIRVNFPSQRINSFPIPEEVDYAEVL